MGPPEASGHTLFQEVGPWEGREAEDYPVIGGNRSPRAAASSLKRASQLPPPQAGEWRQESLGRSVPGIGGATVDLRLQPSPKQRKKGRGHSETRRVPFPCALPPHWDAQEWGFFPGSFCPHLPWPKVPT